MTRFLTIISIFCVISLPTLANPYCFDLFSGGRFQQVSRFGNYGSRAHSIKKKKIRLLLWNLHKMSDSELASDLGNLARGVDFIISQEAVDTPELAHDLVLERKGLGWTMAQSFQQRAGNYTGVATASRVQPLRDVALRSNVSEPIFHTTKTALISEFLVEGSVETLLLVNVHAINFVGLGTFSKHIDQVVQAISQHRGPLIIAGDFNTWSKGRLEYLKFAFELEGINHLPFERGEWLVLDHVFSRGFKLISQRVHSDIISSDHKPLEVELEFDLSQ